MSTAVMPATSAWNFALPNVRDWFRFRVGVCDVLLLVFMIGLLARSRGSMLDDPGLGWHLRNIDAMWDAGGWLMSDPFTLQIADWPWRTNVWLGDAYLYAGWKWGGLEGIAVVTSLVLAATFIGLFRMLVADGLAWPVAALWTYFAGVGTSLSWTARPNVFTLPGVMIVAWLCDRYHRGLATRRQMLWLWPLFALWVNLHGGFVAGIVILAVATAVEVALALGIPHRRDLLAARGRALFLVGLTAGSLVSCLANPYGWEIFAWIGRLLSNPFFMNLNTEWQSPDFHGLGSWRFEMFILGLPLLIALSKRRPSLTALAISIVFLHYALHGQRYVALWVLATAPLVARLSVDVPWLRKLVHRVIPEETRARCTAPPPRSSLATSGAMVLAVLIWAWAVEGVAYHDPKHIPVTALETTIAHAQGKPVFHHYNWGGWLVWHGWPQVHSFIDDRNEVHGQAHIQEYFSIIEAQPGWREKLDKYGFATICIPPYQALAQNLLQDPGWKSIYEDEFAVVLQRK